MGEREPGGLEAVVREARLAVLAWPRWKRSDYVRREFPRLYAEAPSTEPPIDGPCCLEVLRSEEERARTAGCTASTAPLLRHLRDVHPLAYRASLEAE